MHWLELDNLGLTEGGVEIIRDISLQLTGNRQMILGPNGAGKSTLLRLIHGLLHPSHGAIRWPRKMRQAMLFQRPVMLRSPVLRNIEYGLDVQSIPQPQRRQRALQALRRVGLEALANRQARKLSGGEQQRVALARAWTLKPDLLLLDEPTASLDPASSREVERIILEMAEEGTRILMTTHNLGLAHRVADEILFLDRGRLLEQTSVKQFFHSPQTAAAQHFLQDEQG